MVQLATVEFAEFCFDIPPILQEIFSLKMGCTIECIIFCIKHSWKVIIFYALIRL